MSRTKTLALIDGHALAYRMYFALQTTGMSAPDGTPTWAVYGFFVALFNLLRDRNPDALAVAFDVSRISFRNDWYPDYKANRSSMPDDMKAQMSLLLEGIATLDIPVFQIKGVEADDVIGTLSRRVSDLDDWQVEILTGDQDAFQLVDEAGKVSVLIPARTTREGLKRYDWQAVIDKWAVTPAQVTDFKGLKGDTSDNIPGVPGVGDKTAAKLLAQFPTLEAIYEGIEGVSAKKLREKLETNKEIALLSKKLAVIDRHLDFDFDLDACSLAVEDPSATQAFFERCGFNSFLRQFDEIANLFDSEADPVAEVEASADPFEYETVTSLDELTAFLEKAKQQGVFALDLETTGLDPRTAQPVGLGLSLGASLRQDSHPTDNPLRLVEYPDSTPSLSFTQSDELIQNLYVPLGHTDADGARLPHQLSWETDVKPLIQPFLEDEALAKLVHNLKYETNVLKHWGVELKGFVFDTMIASYVLNADRKHGLKMLASAELGLDMTEIKTLIGTGKSQIGFEQVPVEQAAEYGARDTYATWCLAELFTQQLQGEPGLSSLLYELELPLGQVLAQMEDTGISLDLSHLATLSEQLTGQVETLEAQVIEQAGEPFNLNSPKQVGEILFEKLAIPPLKKTASKSGYSTDAKVLEKLAPDYPIVDDLLAYRQLFKLKSTYVDALPQLVHPQTQRVHTSFNQTVTATGRLSSSEPNLQNIPVRSDIGRSIREAFVPAPMNGNGKQWHLLSADYSQIELRLLAHLSDDQALIKAFNAGADIHSATAALVFDIPLEDVTKDQRYQAKAVNFGVVYGQSAHGLSEQLKVTRVEAQRFIDQYFETYPGVQRFIEDTKALAHEQGWVDTLFYRRRNLRSGLSSSVRSIREFSERAAFNTPIQGGAADLMKLAMVRLKERLAASDLNSRLLLQVHDELVLEAPDNETDTLEVMVREAMELGQPLQVPLVVDVHWGANWMEN